MILKVKEVSTKQITSNTFDFKGKQMTGYRQWVKDDDDKVIQVEAYSKDFIENLKPGQYEIKSEYKGVYRLVTPNKQGGFNQKHKYTKEALDKLADTAIEYADSRVGRECPHWNSVFATWLIQASNSGIEV